MKSEEQWILDIERKISEKAKKRMRTYAILKTVICCCMIIVCAGIFLNMGITVKAQNTGLEVKHKKSLGQAIYDMSNQLVPDDDEETDDKYSGRYVFACNMFIFWDNKLYIETMGELSEKKVGTPMVHEIQGVNQTVYTVRGCRPTEAIAVKSDSERSTAEPGKYAKYVCVATFDAKIDDKEYMIAGSAGHSIPLRSGDGIFGEFIFDGNGENGRPTKEDELESIGYIHVTLYKDSKYQDIMCEAYNWKGRDGAIVIQLPRIFTYIYGEPLDRDDIIIPDLYVAAYERK